VGSTDDKELNSLTLLLFNILCDVIRDVFNKYIYI